MTLAIMTTPPPLAVDPGGMVRVANTRVTLDTVVGAFRNGATPEEITQRYPSLSLADVYAVISYYLQHRDEVGAYLRQGQEQSEQVRRQNEARFNPVGARARPLARHGQQG